MTTTNIIKRLMVATYLLVTPLLLFAQNRIAYAYNAAGNRVSGTIVMPTRSASQFTEKSNCNTLSYACRNCRNVMYLYNISYDGNSVNFEYEYMGAYKLW